MRIQRYTLFDLPIVSPILRWIAILGLRLAGWRAAQAEPTPDKYVMVAAPHTSNWDGLVMILIGLELRMKVFWLVKDSLFRFPFRTCLRWWGAIPIDRSAPQALVAQAVEKIRELDRIALLIAPEGTRKKVDRWRTGFYHIATGAHVPLVLGFLDYRRKVGGVGPVFEPSGDLEADLVKIGAFFANVTGKYPELYSPPV